MLKGDQKVSREKGKQTGVLLSKSREKYLYSKLVCEDRKFLLPAT